MIYRLVKFDMGWMLTLVMMVMVALLGLVFRLPPVIYGTGFPLFLIFILSYRQLTYRPCSIFEASLPIHGRQILCARLLARLAYIWGLVIAMALTKLALGRPSKWLATRIALETGAALTLALLSYACYRTGKNLRAAGPRTYMSQIVIGAFCVLGILIFPKLPLLLVVLLFAIVAATLFLYAWIRTPESIQIFGSGSAEILAQRPWLMHTTPGEAQIQGRAESEISKINPDRRTSVGSHSLIVRILYARPYFLSLVTGGLMVLLAGGAASPILFLMVAAVLTQVHTRSLWLFTLPISRRQIFVRSLLPAVAIALVSYGLHFYVWGIFFPLRWVLPTPRVLLVGGTLLVAGCLLTALGVHTLWWHRVRGILKAMVCISCIVITASPFAYPFLTKAGRDSVQAAMNWFLRLLPNSPWALAGLALIFLGGLYYLASRQFCELEVPQFQLSAGQS